MMFEKMRRNDRELREVSELEAILQAGEYGVLATNGLHGYPYAVPLSYVYLNGKLYFHGAPEGSKLNNIRADERVSFCVVGHTCILPAKFSTQYESVIVFGRAGEAGAEEKQAALTALVAKYSPEYREQGQSYIGRVLDKTLVLRLDIEHMTGKARR